MAGLSLLANTSTTAERQRLLEQLKKLEEKDEQALQEREALTGKIVIAALKNEKLSNEDFGAFIAPLITKKPEAKKLGPDSDSQAANLDDSSDASLLSDAKDDAGVKRDEEAEEVPAISGYAQTSDEDDFT